MDRTIPILLALAFLEILHQSTAGAFPQRPAWRDPLRWFCLVLALSLLWALYWTDSRGAELAVLIVVFLFFAFEVRSKLVFLVGAGAGILGTVLFWPDDSGSSAAGYGP
jgi:hypothetical protein